MRRRGAAEQLDLALELDVRRRRLVKAVEERRALQNRSSDKIAEAKRSGNDAGVAIAAMRDLSQALKDDDAKLRSVQEELDACVAALPNIPEPEAPDSERVLREVGAKPEFGFTPLDHLALGTRLGLIDQERAARISGARFAYIMGDLVLVELALIRYAFDRLAPHGFVPVSPPVLVREQAMFATGFFPTDEQQIYATRDDDLYLVGTSEVPLAGIHLDETLEGGMPRRYAGFSTCFRREAGAAGRDTRGIFRVHQFDKVEMFSFCDPASSGSEHELILSIEEEILSGLDIPYRVVDIPVDDLGAPAARKFDCEAWLPGQDGYRELTSCSNTTDFQARRLGCRFRPSPGEPSRSVHTLNGTAVAIGRTLVAIMENHQQADGTIALPASLHPFGAPRALIPRDHGE